MRQLSGSDAFFLYSDKPGQHQHLSTLYIYDQSTAPGGAVRFKTILDHVRDRLSSSRIFRRRMVKVPLNLDYPYWVEDENFQLEFHVRHIALPQPGDWRQFCIQVSRLHSRALDMSRPVWEMYVIEGLDNISFLPEGAFAIMTKVHHAAIDDFTEEDFTTTLHDLPTAQDSSTMRLRWHPEQEPGIAQMLTLAWFNNTTRLLETAQTVWDKLPLVGSKRINPNDVLHRSEEKAPETRFDQKITPYRVWDACFFELDDVALINRAVPEASPDEIVLTICSGAIRRYLANKGEFPEETLWALLPIHELHSDFDDHIDKSGRGHRVSLTRTRLMTTIVDPLDRLMAICRELGQAETRTIDSEEMDEFQDILPSTTMTLATKAIAARFGPGRSFRENHNMVINIIPGPQHELSLCGARLLAFTGMSIILDHLALSHTVTTYNGQLAIAPVSDRKLMPDPAFYAECLQASFEELKAAAKTQLGQAAA